MRRALLMSGLTFAKYNDAAEAEATMGNWE